MIDELTLKVGNKLVQGWDDIRVTRGIERLPSDFDLSLMDYYPGSDGEELVRKGDSCQVMLGDDLVMTGYIDRWNPALSKSRHEIRATGRSKCQDLVDCSAEWPNNVISQANALQIAQRLAAPYGINVSSDVEDMATVPQFTLNWGESSQEVIDRISRWAALLYFDTPDGNLLLTRVGTRKAASGVAQGENIEYASFTDSMDERFSDYIGVSMTTTPVAEFSPNAGYDAVTLARARDPEAAKMRYRNRVIIVESTMIANQQAQNCIDWEMNRRFGRSRQLQVTIDSWRDKSGKLWEPNTLIPINLPKFGLKDELWLLAEVTFLRGEQGTTARMVLMPPAAFAVQPYAFYRQLLEVN
ncbi:phage baseplate assembly protein [Serratia fonticola]|uniref:Contractile injection system protein, VgrG/Pvc8 family n=1 Tax=Serratia fonticola TaxID=47917 RepID=A0ABY9PIV2_SERFO|nr:contractile injection system protein, VgrG/Pvc8 family [Serratia fonticola]OKP27665.1 phage tail protein [Serratia fonticola]WMT13347.1 contractile injection system protein, VgrG/Pvc8 family [Serratia fonticola]